MDFDFSVIKNPFSTASVALRTVYVVYADSSYDVRKGVILNKDLIALRTIRGMGNIKIADLDEITVFPGTLLFFEHAKTSRYYCSSEEWDFWWFEFSTNGGSALPLNTLLYIDTVENELNDCHVCLEMLRKNDSASSNLASATLNLLLCKWLLHYENKEKSNPYRDVVGKAINYLRSNLGKNVSVEELADMSGFCERRFRQIFKSVTGARPKKYIEALRIGMAEEMLVKTNLPIYEISIKLGYSSQFHFSKAFRKIHGIPPMGYRNRKYLNI